MSLGLLVPSVRSWVNAGLGFLYPEWCQICDGARATPDEGYVCGRCRESVELIKRPFCEQCGRPFPGVITGSFTCGQCREVVPWFVYARSAGVAKGVLLEAIHRYKYQGALWLEGFLAGVLIEGAECSLVGGGWDVVVGVPLHVSRVRGRGFNQAERLARRLGAATGIVWEGRVLRRVVATRSQTELSREERLENVRGAFALAKEGVVKGKRVVLVDDVFTTGATSNACAEVLMRGGAASVCVWTVARGN